MRGSGESRTYPPQARYDTDMRSRVSLFALLLLISSFALPLVAYAAIPFFGPIVPDAANVCAAGWGMLMVVINNIISLLITLAIVFVAPLMIAYAGFLYVVNPVDPSGISKAKSILTNTVVGIIIALCGWLIVDAIMVVLYNPGADVPGGKIGVWSSLIGSGGILPCVDQKGSLSTDSLNQSITGVSATGITTTGGNVLVNINSAANAYIGASTANAPGTNNGRLACAWAVNQVLTNAGIAPIDGSSVQSMENTLQGGRGTLIDQSTALPGDIVIQAGDSHVGICLNAGCTQVISNSSSNASFTFRSGPDFAPAYNSGPGRVYRVKS